MMFVELTIMKRIDAVTHSNFCRQCLYRSPVSIPCPIDRSPCHRRFVPPESACPRPSSSRKAESKKMENNKRNPSGRPAYARFPASPTSIHSLVRRASGEGHQNSSSIVHSSGPNTSSSSSADNGVAGSSTSFSASDVIAAKAKVEWA